MMDSIRDFTDEQDSVVDAFTLLQGVLLPQMTEQGSSALSFSESNLRRTLALIEVGHKYKCLHDLFQSMERNFLLINSLSNGQDQLSVLNVMEELHTTTDDLLALAADSPFAESETPCVRFLEHAQEALTRIEERYSEHQHKSMIGHVKRALTMGPSSVDKCLVDIAGKLELSDLAAPIETSAAIAPDLATIDSPKLVRLQKGVDALGRLDACIKALVSRHELWQSFDNYLNLITANPSDLATIWRDLAEMADELYGHTEENWAKRLRRYEAELDSVLPPSVQQPDRYETASDQSPVALLSLIEKHFDDQELRTLCFKLDIDYEDLPGEGKSSKARELLLLVRRTKRLSALVEVVQRERPELPWAHQQRLRFSDYQRAVKNRFRDVDIELLSLFSCLKQISNTVSRFLDEVQSLETRDVHYDYA